MNAKNLYDEGEINEYEEEDNEIIDNDDCFDDSLLKSKKSIDQKEITNQENKNENTLQRIQNEVKNIVAETTLTSNDTLKKNTNNIEKEKNEINNDKTNFNLDNYSKEELIEILMNNPIKKDDEKIEKKEEKVEKNNIKNEDINSNIKIKDISEKEEEESDFNKALNKVLSKMIKKKNINNNELYDLLVSDKETIENELKKYNLKRI